MVARADRNGAGADDVLLSLNSSNSSDMTGTSALPIVRSNSIALARWLRNCQSHIAAAGAERGIDGLL